MLQYRDEYEMMRTDIEMVCLCVCLRVKLENMLSESGVNRNDNNSSSFYFFFTHFERIIEFIFDK